MTGEIQPTPTETPPPEDLSDQNAAEVGRKVGRGVDDLLNKEGDVFQSVRGVEEIVEAMMESQTFAGRPFSIETQMLLAKQLIMAVFEMRKPQQGSPNFEGLSEIMK